jgi:hypothetical protein
MLLRMTMLVVERHKLLQLVVEKLQQLLQPLRYPHLQQLLQPLRYPHLQQLLQLVRHRELPLM